MHFQSRVSTTTVHEIPFVDDCTFHLKTEGDMKSHINFIATACNNSGLIIDREKTMVIHQPPSNTASNVIAPDCKPWTPSPICVTDSPAASKSTMRSPPDLEDRIMSNGVRHLLCIKASAGLSATSGSP
ncbi:unnamed protein product [Schistocephalus solidus]|uniref:Reverse transcriptase domain-containing protein n=1 Tax=Schistocephalus solidus TaxID=70667 RepID=A0A183T7Y9_SCHSO|nr:unnamed protein product [Schistocephalus solidus]